jgi:hypothetical protein
MQHMVLSGDVTQRVHFQAPTNQGPNMTVRRKRGAGVWAAMVTPTVTEDDPTNCPGAYSLLLDEDMVITPGLTTEQMAFYISGGLNMVPVMVTVSLYKYLQVNVKQLDDAVLNGDGTASNKWRA